MLIGRTTAECCWHDTQGFKLDLETPKATRASFRVIFAAVETRCFADNRINKAIVSHAFGFGFTEPRRGINGRRDNYFAS